MSDAYVPEMLEAKAVPGSSPRLRSLCSPPLHSVIPNVLVAPLQCGAADGRRSRLWLPPAELVPVHV